MFTLPSVTGLARWVDYIPVKEVVPARGRSYDEGGAIAVTELASETGSVRGVDHIPVFEVTDADSTRWRIEAEGFIPVDGLTP